MTWHGDIALGDTIDIKFTTVGADGAPATLAGSPAVAAYVGNGTTEITAGITLTVDFDARTGLHNLRVVASSGNGFAAGSDVDLVITAGTVGGTSVVGYKVASFSIEKRSALRPTTAGRTLDVASTGEAGIDLANVNLPNGPLPFLGIFDNGTAQSVTATTLVARAAAPDNSVAPGMTLFAFGSTQGYWQSVIIDSVSADTLTHAGWPIATPSGTITYFVLGTPQASAATPIPANVRQINGVAVVGAGTSGNKWRA